MKLMVGDDNVAPGISIPTHRKAFDDVTNRTGKRSFSLISDDFPLPRKNQDDTDDGDFHLEKQVCLGIQNSVREKSYTKTGINTRDKFVSFPSTKQDFGFSTGNRTFGKSHVSNGANDKYSMLETNCVDVVPDGSLMEDGNGVRDRRASSVSLPAFSDPLRTIKPQFEESGLIHELSQAKSSTVSEGLITIAAAKNDRDLGLGKLPSNNYETIACSIPGSQNSKFPVLEKCTSLKGHGNTVSGVNLLDCSCSFCSKAAHIWSDLHYQDIKGRIAALKKSQKEASSLVQNISGEMEALIRDQGSSSRSSKLEFNLMDHWRSLFHHMDNALAHESDQLEETCHTLKDLRHNCKMDLEMINDELPGNS